MTNPDLTSLSFVVDRSGSMKNIKKDMEGAIAQVLDDQKKLPGELRVDVWTFDDKIEHLVTDSLASEMTGVKIEPRGVTSLNDAVGTAITTLGLRFALQEEDARPGKVILAIVTDGYENSSKEYTVEMVKGLVERQKNEFQWEILFFGADSIDAFAVAQGYGIGGGQTMSFAATEQGVFASGLAASEYITRSRTTTEPIEFTEEERKAAEQK